MIRSLYLWNLPIEMGTLEREYVMYRLSIPLEAYLTLLEASVYRSSPDMHFWADSLLIVSVSLMVVEGGRLCKHKCLVGDEVGTKSGVLGEGEGSRCVH